MRLPEGTVALHGNDVTIAYPGRKEAERAFDILESAASPASPLSAEVEELVGRLLKVDPDDGDEGTTCYYRNPDGHEAAALIRSLSAQLETARAEAGRIRRETLEEAAKVAFDEMFSACDAIRALKLQTAIRALGEDG